MSKRAARDRILRHTIHVVVAAVSMLVHAGDSVEHCGGLWSSTTNANVKLGGSDDESSGGGVVVLLDASARATAKNNVTCKIDNDEEEEEGMEQAARTAAFSAF